MYSLVITNYNRCEYVIQSFIQVLDNDLISDIVIIDDYSDKEIYDRLKVLIDIISNDKIKLFRNDKNLGPLMNKYEAVKKADNEWCIMLDSDNIIDDTYVNIVNKLNKDDNIIYCPETLYKIDKNGVNFSYKQFAGLVVDKNNVRDYIKNKYFECWLNTGNYFFKRQKYLDTIEKNNIDLGLGTSDSVYFSYLWLISGRKMMLVPELGYVHRIHKGSWYKTHLVKCNDATVAIKKLISVL